METKDQQLTLAQVRAIGRAGEHYEHVGHGTVYRFIELRDGTGFARGSKFILTPTNQ